MSGDADGTVEFLLWLC